MPHTYDESYVEAVAAALFAVNYREHGTISEFERAPKPLQSRYKKEASRALEALEESGYRLIRHRIV